MVKNVLRIARMHRFVVCGMHDKQGIIDHVHAWKNMRDERVRFGKLVK